MAMHSFYISVDVFPKAYTLFKLDLILQRPQKLLVFHMVYSSLNLSSHQGR